MEIFLLSESNTHLVDSIESSNWRRVLQNTADLLMKKLGTPGWYIFKIVWRGQPLMRVQKCKASTKTKPNEFKVRSKGRSEKIIFGNFNKVDGKSMIIAKWIQQEVKKRQAKYFAMQKTSMALDNALSKMNKERKKEEETRELEKELDAMPSLEDMLLEFKTR